MISRLRMINLRRHVDTELSFDDDGAQIIAITGANGAGKSTLLEAITYALYGEGRQGRRNLARLVRRGGEHEGLQVELDFHVGDVQYELVRRYEKGKTSATLMANGNLIMQSADGVTAEVAKILGMDSAGFRLAVCAQQFDVDGLADLQPAQRRRTVTRLLRQDALTRARNAAADEKNRQLDVLRAMGTGPDMDALRADLDDARAEVASCRAALADSESAVAALDRELADTATTREAWGAAQLAVARAEATAAAFRSEADRLEAELAAIHIPAEPAAPQVPLARLVAELSQVNIAIGAGEAGAELARTVESTRAELEATERTLRDLSERLGQDTPASVAMALAAATGEVAVTTQAHAQARDRVVAVSEQRVAPAGELAALRARRTRATGLGDVCEACEQPITAAHKHRQAAQFAEREAQLLAQLADLDAELEEARTQALVAEQAALAARSSAERLAARRQIVDNTMRDRREHERRAETYRANLARIVVPDVDLEGLYAQKGTLELAKAAAEQYEQTALVRSAALERAGRVGVALEAARARVEAAELEIAAAEPDADLLAAHERLVQIEARRADEAEMVAAIRVDLATRVEREQACDKLIAAAKAQHDRLAVVRAGADRAAKAARLLEVTAERMATSIRPALEGAISDALSRLSEGRFTSVQVSDTYDITVLDDSTYQPLSELSGGERVLVALATRLALAQVVAGRHAQGGVGLLVLDEVFGSQDAERREAILSALRALRAEYGQILLISHVGGLEEVADLVVDVAVRVEEGVRVADVAIAA